jgi:hypothetical protein
MPHSFRIIRRAGVAAALFASTQASGYLISPRLAVHETMTRMAFDCAARAGPAGPTACWTTPGLLPSIVEERYSPREMAARWPDDPLRQGNSLFTAPGLGYDVGWGCAGKIKDAAGHDRTIYEAGLLCSSHYGRLQFVHAMASGGDGRRETLRKIQAWSAFTFDVASGRIPVDADICRTVTTDGKRAYAALAGAFDTASGNSCVVPKGGKAKTVRAFFATDCSRFPLAKKCGVWAGKVGDALVRRAALGALMHLIQDSYSQSHVARPIDGKTLEAAGPFTATAACTFPVTYFDYGRQSKNHADADQRPRLDRSCRAGAPVDDPVTASARVAWMIERRGTARDLTDYLTDRVFGPL